MVSWRTRMPSVAISMRSDLLDMHDVCYMSLRLAKVTGLFIWIPYAWLTVSKGMLEVQSRGKRDCRDCIADLPAALVWPTVRLQESDSSYMWSCDQTDRQSASDVGLPGRKFEQLISSSHSSRISRVDRQRTDMAGKAVSLFALAYLAVLPAASAISRGQAYLAPSHHRSEPERYDEQQVWRVHWHEANRETKDDILDAIAVRTVLPCHPRAHPAVAARP